MTDDLGYRTGQGPRASLVGGNPRGMMRRLVTIAIAFALTGCIAADPGAHPVSAAQLDGTWLRAAPVPVVVQRAENDCGAAALAMLVDAWGQSWTLDDALGRVHPGRDGVKLAALRDAARAAGLDAYAIRGTRDDLAHELAAGRPVLLGLVLPVDREHNRNHYEVAVALDPQHGDVVTIDPANGRMQRRESRVFDLEWKTAGYAALVVVSARSKKEGPRS